MMEVGTARVEMGWMREEQAGAVLGGGRPAEQLQQRLEADGYLLVRDLIPPAAVGRALATIVATLREAGVLALGDDSAECRLAPPSQGPQPDGQYRARSTTRRPYDPNALLQSDEVLGVTDSPELHRLFRALFGEPPAMTGPQVLRPMRPNSFSGYHSARDARPAPRMHPPAPPSPKPSPRSADTQWTMCTWVGGRGAS